MSLRWAATALAYLLATSHAAAETSTAVLGGYGRELPTHEPPGGTSYGIGVGMRAGATLWRGAYVGGTFVTHVGERVRAQGSGGSGYLQTHHAYYVGPELGWDLRLDPAVVRPYVGSGMLVTLANTAARERAIRDDDVSPFVMPGVVVSYRAEPWFVGLDGRVLISTRRPSDVAPAIFTLVGLVLSP